MNTIGFIGGGRVTRIFLQAWSNAGMALDQVTVYDPSEEVLKSLHEKFPRIGVSSNDMSGAAGAGLIFLAVHPPVMMEVLTAIKPLVSPSATIISLAPKFTMDKIGSILGNAASLARINPSASTWINQGVNPVCFSPGMDENIKSEVRELIRPMGYLPEVDEPKIEAYAMITAMGHTYFWFQLQKLRELALSFGMDDEEAKMAISLMMKGTVDTLFTSGLTYPEVTDLVPVKPLGPAEGTIKSLYDEHLVPLFNKIRP